MSTTGTNAYTPTSRTARLSAGAADYLDERIGAARLVKGFARKVFPDHWSFMLGEVALYSFVILLISGTFLTLFYVPSMTLVEYEGSYAPMYGVTMSEAYASSLNLSFDIRGGLLMRQVHHWSALIFVAAIVVHMLRVFFTGAFRKPREFNWVLGVILAVLALAEGFTGYSLPDDLLSGNGLRIIEGVILAIPVVGTYIVFFLFGGEFPGESIIPRLYILHVFVLPGLILAVIALHLALVVAHKHTQYPGPGRTNDNVVGFPLLPVYAAKAGGFFFIVFGVIILISGLVSINAIWNYGPYDPSPISAGTQPDWYIGFVDGLLRLMPGQPEFTIAGFTLSLNVFLPSLVVPGLMVVALLAYPFLEQWVTGDKREHHLLDRPRNAPVRTGIGVMAIVSYCVMWAAAGNDLMAIAFGLSINDLTWLLRFAFFVLPPVAFVVTKRICLSLQRKDRELALHGHETGRVVRTADGEYFEVHEPLSETERWVLVQHEAYRPLAIPPKKHEDGRKVPAHERLRANLSNFFFEDRVEPVTPRELEAARHHGDHEAIEQPEGREAERRELGSSV
ncbi:cytochrome bc complex cytochrome b subunit [uncultured Pseudokineococcus sp.]|uniref:cytochrome bc1 complex cytochrome b subunit n=1 Tax=uncultured Pseudokineococcus sp. TaxID=1642928 RepID=UPI00261439B3|nr:cytochrome bc complex cytochrome b subunit [uncultured Pseudokineococcus sp.]